MRVNLKFFVPTLWGCLLRGRFHSSVMGQPLQQQDKCPFLGITAAMEGPADADRCPVHHSTSASRHGTSPAAEGASQCPVNHSASSWFGLGSWFSGAAAAQPPAAADNAKDAQQQQQQQQINPLTNEFHYSHERQPGQQHPLGVHRQRSTIPKVRTRAVGVMYAW